MTDEERMLAEFEDGPFNLMLALADKCAEEGRDDEAAGWRFLAMHRRMPRRVKLITHYNGADHRPHSDCIWDWVGKGWADKSEDAPHHIHCDLIYDTRANANRARTIISALGSDEGWDTLGYFLQESARLIGIMLNRTYGMHVESSRR